MGESPRTFEAAVVLDEVPSIEGLIVWQSCDLAWLLLCTNHGQHALPLLKQLATLQRRPAEQLIVLRNVARAAGAARDPREFLSAWNELWRVLDSRESDDRAAEALISLARGAEVLGDPTRTVVAAQESLRIAQPRYEKQEVEAAEELLDAVREGRRPQAQIRDAS